MNPTGTAKEEYARRLNSLAATETSLTHRSKLLAGVKLAAIAATVIVAGILAKEAPREIYWLLVPIALIILLFVVHERVLQSKSRCLRLKKFYEQGMARIEDRWAGTGQTGDRFLDASHPYARDLDLFGKGSMFELLSTARTRAGEETLAAWLLAPAPTEEILARQEALRELAPQVDFRERLALAGEDVELGVRPEALIGWSESPDRLDPSHPLRTRALALTLAILWVLSIVAWAALGWVGAVIGMSVLNLILTYRFRARVDKAASSIAQAIDGLDLLAAIFREIEKQNFSTPKLAGIEHRLLTPRGPASQAVERLARRVAWFESHDNMFVKFADLFIFWTAQWTLAIEAWREQYGPAVRAWIEAVGEMEALNALAGYTFEHPADIFPQFLNQGPALYAEQLAHPLIPASKAIGNDLNLDQNLQLLVISGPNMAGKSTFIRSVGINTVLAQAGAPVRARAMQLSRLNVAASICVLDSLQGGLSRFYSEIMRLKQIDEESRGPVPVLFLLDELLSGTNSHDRRVGTESFVRALLARGAVGLITTHDLALAEIADGMAGKAANMHFQDTFENGELQFDYRLTPGIVSTANALKLMRSIGLEI